MKPFLIQRGKIKLSVHKRGGNIDEALGYAQIAKEKMPKNAAVMDTLGWIYYLKGSYLSAISELKDSVELAPDNPVINYHLGLAYYKNNRSKDAKEFLEKALELNPRSVAAKRFLVGAINDQQLYQNRIRDNSKLGEQGVTIRNDHYINTPKGGGPTPY